MRGKIIFILLYLDKLSQDEKWPRQLLMTKEDMESRMLEERSVNEGHTSADDSLLTLQPIFSNGLLGKTWVFTLRDSHSLRLIHLGILIANEITCPNWHVSHKQENQRLNSILHDVVHFQMPSIHQSTCIGTAPTNCFSIYTHQYFAYFSSCV